MYIFKTQQFGLTDHELHLMRSGYPYKKFYWMDVSKIEIKTGSVTKHPIRLTIFALIIIGVVTFIFTSGWLEVHPAPGKTINWSLTARAWGGLVSGLLFLLFVAFYSLRQILTNQLIMVVEFLDGTSEVIKLKPIKKQNKLIHLIEFLMSKFDKSRFRFNEKVVK